MATSFRLLWLCATIPFPTIAQGGSAIIVQGDAAPVDRLFATDTMNMAHDGLPGRYSEF
ncbi:hypothetical protein G5B38_20015 (plasmid) [Pseudohalocynthiibacter aestuariivivens]|uniref:Uncharacterized protein n=1 Tax=Roseovarius pelagicus TaxID=2980108 RepID=A0ABY6D617_9RHOB|nr:MULTISPECIES: hypothetical protein [Rhodobacterales]QIE47902.1 hypothetical protein G5B38_20015 [Pseudohalocynthiibacter aestuariivivens]UXX81592.1 hypothetical protein N7U68_00600 [Roseovarius pelagicus]